MGKIFKVAILVFLIIAVFSRGIYAETTDAPSLVPVPSTVSSYELFWPIVAGKTRADPLYFLKSLKEKLRGLVIVGPAQKADYVVLLATKRVVEAEKLIVEGELDLAEETLQQAGVSVDRATSEVNKALAGNVLAREQTKGMLKRLSDLETFIPLLIEKTERNNETLTSILKKIALLRSRL